MQMVGLYKDPTGKDVFSKTVPSDDHQSADVGELRVRVKRLEKRLTEISIKDMDLKSTSTNGSPCVKTRYL